jgi:hypothetical protein
MMFYIYQYNDIENEETKKLIHNITLNKQKYLIGADSYVVKCI